MKRLSFVLVIYWLLTACSCAVFKSSPASSEEALRRRAEGYWSARQEKDLKKMRSFVDPTLVDNLEDFFKKMEKSKEFCNIRSFSIQDLKVSGEEGYTWTALSLHLVHPLLGADPYPLEQTVEDKWVLRKGQWYLVIQPPNLADILRKLNRAPKE